MWKKPSIEMPDFEKCSLKEILENEAVETNGGSVINLNSDDFIIDVSPTRPPGYVSQSAFNFKQD